MVSYNSLYNFQLHNNNIQNKQNLSFAGKKSVQINFLGDKYLVPREVADVRKSIKSCISSISDDGLWGIANVVNLKDYLFLGIAHIIDDYTKIRQSIIGKYFTKSTSIARIAGEHLYKHKKNKTSDLGVFWTCKSYIYPKYVKSTPVKFAKELPQKGEQIYLVGYHGSYVGSKAIPAEYKGKEYTSEFNFGLVSNKIANKDIDGHGFSGSAIVNKNGELIGILSSGFNNPKNGTSMGYFEGVDINHIKKFLESNKVNV